MFVCYYGIIIIIIIIIIGEVFTPACADGLLLESEWYQVSSSLQESSQYSGPSKQCCGLDGLDLSNIFQIFQHSFQVFRERSKLVNFTWYQCHVPQLS